MSEATVCFEGVRKVFGKVRALDGVSLEIERGTIYCLLGANGAGKSTALRLLLNRMSVSSGTVRVLGKAATDLRSEDFGRIAYVSESQKLYDWKTLDGLIATVRPLYPTWDEVYCEKLIELFRLPRDRKIKTLSRGMKMKVKMLLAFSFQPEVVVMDEPLTGLDPIVRRECIEGLIDWANEGERTLVISSHDVDDVEPICDRVGILHEGAMLLDESLESLKARMRRVTFHCDGDEAVGEMPGSWMGFRKVGRSYELMDTEFEAERSLARVKKRFPEAKDVGFAALSLKELFIGFVQGREK